ncbi:MAG TPA: flagellar hook capping FlgD N-terminal domain-containing protein [Capillimicrobium sp.]|nr:flagellar hook capping FlgD N-terminal domain-containing protein [Capillimicrobium sp.]
MSTTTTVIGSDAAAKAATAAAAGSTTPTSSAAKTTGADGFGMDKDAFLKILVEQLRHQDPSNPGDSQEYIQQMTQYSILEQLTNISEASQQQTAADAGNTAIALVGRTVTYTDEDGEEQSGVVKGVDFSTGTPTLTVGETAGIELGSVTEVR